MSFPYKNPITSLQVGTTQSVPKSNTYGLGYSVNNIGGYMEVYSLNDLIYTIPTGTTGSIEYSGNTIPIEFTKGNGNPWSRDVLTLGSDNISSGRRRLGMLVYVIENELIYQFDIDGYETLWNNATGATNTVNISEFGTIVNNSTSQGQAFINAWTGSTIEGVSGNTRATSVWKKFYYLSLSGGTVSGPTIFQSGLTANTISATTYDIGNYIQFYTGNTNPSNVGGRIFYDNLTNDLAFYSFVDQNVKIKLGKQLYTRVNNFTGSLIPKGSALAIQSASNGIPNVTLVTSSGRTNNEVIGLAAADIPNGVVGLAINQGVLLGINLSYPIGTILYLSDTVPGGYVSGTTSLQFSSRSHQIGYVIATGTTTGEIYVSIKNEDTNLTLTDIERNILEGNVISSGVYEYTGMTQGTGSTINISLVRGWVPLNTNVFATLPDVINIYYSGGTNIPLTNLATADSTFILINTASTVVQQTIFPTPQQRRENLFLGKVVHVNRSTITSINQTVDFDVSPMSAIRDLWTPLKLINQGVIVSPHSTTLEIDTSAGTLWGNGIGWTTNQLNPDSISISGTSPTTFQYRSQLGPLTGGSVTTGNTTTINPGYYDLNGVVTAVGGGSNSSTNQRVYLFPTGLVRIQLGQKVYGTLVEAVAGVQTEQFVEYSLNRDNGILIGVISLNKSASNLSLPAQAVFSFTSKFGEVLGGTGGLSTTTLQQAYDNSTEPEILINSTLDGLSIRNGTGNADNVTQLLQGQNTAGTVTSFIRADGAISGTSISTPILSGDSTQLLVSGGTSTDLVRITQTGSGAAFRVEDSDNPDSTPFVISGDGKVYIGTTTETTSVLNVGGNSHFYGNIFLNGTTNRAIQNSTAGRALINFATAGDSYFNNGNLGIGTISPGSKLDIDASTGSTIGIRVTGGTSVDMVRITQTGSGNAIVVEDETNPDATPFVVAADGRVGIGLTAPLSSYKLHVRNGTATSSAAAAGTIATFEGSGATYVTVLSPDASNAGITFGSGSDRLGAFVAWNYNSNQFSFNTDKTGGFITFSTDDQFERMRITSAGNVGIGTTSPENLFHVFAGSAGTVTSVAGTVATIENSTTNYLSMIAPDNQYSGIVFGSPSDSFGAYMRWKQSDTFLDISTADFGDYIRLGAGNSDFKAYVTSTGFGVNTLPSQALDISGNTLIRGGLTATTISGSSITLSNSASTISLNNATQQQIRFFSGGTGAPTYNTYSAGAKIILSDNIDSISSGYAIGVDSGSLWYGADLAGNGHDWYAGTRKLASLVGSSGFQLFGLGGPGTSASMTISGTSALGSKGGTGYTDFLQVINNWSGATNPNKWFRLNSIGGFEILNSAYSAQIFSLTDTGILSVAGGNLATTSSSDGVTNYLMLGNNNTQIYDDGNTHIHSRAANQSMWINTNGGQLNLLTQSPLLGGSIGSGIAIATSTLNGYVTINTGRTVTTAASYGYLINSSSPTGQYNAGSQTLVISLYANNRIWGQEIDAFSDERMKDIHGEITLEEGIKLVKNLKPIKYNWKEGDDKGTKAGYSAQQVIKSGFDHLIGLIPTEGLEETIDDDGFLSPKDTQFAMNYDQVTPYHGVVIKHLLEEIENLKNEIKELKSKIK